MKHFFQFDPPGFFNDQLHADAIPAAAVEVTEEEYARLLDGLSRGLQIVQGPGGRPELAPREIPVEVLARRVRRRRDALLTESDRRVLPDFPQSDPDRLAWLAYRQLLREVPAQSGFPQAVEWPVAPQ